MRTLLYSSTLFSLALLGIVATGCSKDSSNPYAPAATSATVVTPPANTVLMSGMVFNPVTITVRAGTTITWKNNDGLAHTSTSDTGVWDTGNIPAGGSATTTFNTAGTFPYNCTYHAAMGMRGTVVVQ